MRSSSLVEQTAGEPALALDRAAITVSRDTTSLQAARQVKGVVMWLGTRGRYQC